MRRSPYKGRLLICDMDGTLLDSSGKISSENKAAIFRYVEGGGLFTLATGRPVEAVKPYLPELPVNVPAILYNGAVIYDFQSDSICWENNLPASIIRPIRQMIAHFPDIGVQVCHGGRIYVVRPNDYTNAHMLREKFKPIFTELDEIPQPWIKILLAWDPEKLRDVEQYLNGFSEPFRHVYSEPQFLEVLNKGVSKGNALRVLTNKLGLSGECVIAMGDNLNDVELIEEANIGIAVGNAHSLLKAAADLCCAHHDRNAVSEVIDWIKEGKLYKISVINDTIHDKIKASEAIHE